MRYLILALLVLTLHAERITVTQHFNVVTTTVKEESVKLSKTFYGYTAVDESRIVDVVPRYSGYVETLYADKLYKHLHKGEKIAKVYSPEVFKAKEEYLRSYNYAKSAKGSKGMVRSSEIKLALLGVDKQEIASVVKTGKSEELTTIFSPADGLVFEKAVEKGSSFAKGQKLFRIISLDKEWVRIKVSDADIEWVRSVQDFEVSFDGLKQVYKAKFDIVEPKLDPKEALYTVRAVLENVDKKIYPGMYAKVKASKILGVRLVVPASAVIRKNGKHYAFLATEFKGEFEPIEIDAKRLGDRYIVKSGLQKGDEIVKSAMFMMDSDAQINSLY